MASATTANHATSVAELLVSSVVAAVAHFGISAGAATTLVSDIAVRRSSERRVVAALGGSARFTSKSWLVLQLSEWLGSVCCVALQKASTGGGPGSRDTALEDIVTNEEFAGRVLERMVAYFPKVATGM
ncbi:hypothetical protein ABOM_002895 [Aspergillus bombycis]|uniref:Uncharacterized protein n=1 Tax=Aspergillus bombycis TaxID=109264 RepID=A0A1F8A8Q6_9EURO|nr:hypothetical protein ABOM_002895 [Aspergillus bombycis]OGM48077.1 hypothetical protein ABOM_002895 [Aspergillus bombycis]